MKNVWKATRRRYKNNSIVKLHTFAQKNVKPQKGYKIRSIWGCYKKSINGPISPTNSLVTFWKNCFLLCILMSFGTVKWGYFVTYRWNCENMAFSPKIKCSVHKSHPIAAAVFRSGFKHFQCVPAVSTNCSMLVLYCSSAGFLKLILLRFPIRLSKQPCTHL